MQHTHDIVHRLLRGLDLGSSVAEQDRLLETARIDTSAFADLIEDRIDLIPGTKGSGKTALYRIVVDFLPAEMLKKRKVVVAHGVRHHGDQVFQVFKDRFGKLSENDFVNFWCIYLVSLANEHFIKSTTYAKEIRVASTEVKVFKAACRQARIPEFQDRSTLREVLDWALTAVQSFMPKGIKYKSPHDGSEITVDLFGNKTKEKEERKSEADLELPLYVNTIKDALADVLDRCGLHIWLMIDRLDEIFPRRSVLETRALRGLLRVLRIFESPSIRVKIFLRDDILEQLVEEKGFTALTHVASRKSKPLAWTEEQITRLIVRRLFAHKQLADYLKVNPDRLDSYPRVLAAFHQVFPKTIYKGDRKISTVKWIYSRASDGRGVVTPRDVIELLRNAIQHQQDMCLAEISGVCDDIIGSSAVREGYHRMSKDKATNYLMAEFPHLWPKISKFSGGKTAYDQSALKKLFGNSVDTIIKDLLSLGVISIEKRSVDGATFYKIPFLYRVALNTTQGRMRY